MKKNIRTQILTGYLIILIVPIILTLVTVIYSAKIGNDVENVNDFRQNQNMTKEAIVGHYSWIMGLGDTILTGKEFKGSNDPATCGLGKWMSSVEQEDLKDPAIKESIDILRTPHDKIHNEVDALIEMAQVDKDKAYEKYTKDVKPEVAGIIEQITIVTDRYMVFAEEAEKRLSGDILKMIVINILLVIAGIVAAGYYGNRTAKRISMPVSIVAEWSRRMSLGDNEFDKEELHDMNIDPENEIAQMIASFEIMATSIQNNVKVVERVAAGDLTAFVDIRSNMDVLGKNLYRMVQENDHIFADILEISSNVASSAHQISMASASLAQNTAEQAATIEEISGSMEIVNTLTKENKDRVIKVQESFELIHEEVADGTDKMHKLVEAVTDIKQASDRISSVIKSIDDISMQTNILALNASVEAARAGVAGKGFAVVADEVRQLALKSAVAAGESKALIENTIAKTHYGTKVASEANESFDKISSSVDATIYIAKEIVDAAGKQSLSSEQVNLSVNNVAAAAASNSAISEQAAAASDEMRSNAQLLRSEMDGFTLRQRETGKPYIPEEKKNDSEFIKTAEENYNRYIERNEKKESNIEFR